MGESAQKLNIALIGAGNLATNLGLALQRAGHNILYVYSRTEQSSSILAERLGCAWTTSLAEAAEQSKQCDVVIISVKDTALAGIVSQMPQNSRTLFLHTAGSMPMDTLTMPHRGVFYPMQTFSKERAVDFTNIPTFLEVYDMTDKACLESLAQSITHSVYWIDSAQRKRLHLSAVFACNFANYCFDAASEILAKENIPFTVMLPLIHETTEKLNHLSPFDAQTGPAIRYDTNVIDKHIEMLADDADKQQLYKLMSQQIHQRHELRSE